MNTPTKKRLSQGLASLFFTFGLAGWLPAQNRKTVDFSRLVVVGDSLAAGVENGSLEDSQQVHGFANVIAVRCASERSKLHIRQKEKTVSILTVFSLPSMNAEKYNRVISDLEAAGQGKPKGRLYHIASRQEDGSFMVTDVWASPELLAEFGKTLIPILKNAGVTPVEPNVHPVHNIIGG